MFDETILRDTRAIIDLDCVGKSISAIKEKVGGRVDVMAVVKADGYGHGAIKAARKALKSGASSLAVAYPQEGIELRQAKIDAPILVMGLTPAAVPGALESVVKNTLSQAVAERDAPAALSALASPSSPAAVHIKVDTGMGRIGIRPDEVVEYAEFLKKLPNLVIEGIFTHFPSSDESDRSFTDRQIEIFGEIIASLENRGIKIPKRHMANSGGILGFPSSYFNLVRPGIMMYGLYPSSEAVRSIPLFSAMSLVTRICFLKEVLPGTPISYGRTFITERKSLIATLPLGYADGYPRFLSNRGEVLVRGKRARVVGRVCMDMAMIDVTDIPGVAVGDDVTLFGKEGGEEISIDEFAGMLGTINYEVTCMVGKRVPRVYLNE